MWPWKSTTSCGCNPNTMTPKECMGAGCLYFVVKINLRIIRLVCLFKTQVKSIHSDRHVGMRERWMFAGSRLDGHVTDHFRQGRVHCFQVNNLSPEVFSSSPTTDTVFAHYTQACTHPGGWSLDGVHPCTWRCFPYSPWLPFHRAQFICS